MNTDLQQEIEKFLEGITGICVKYNPIPNKGFMIRIPLEPNIKVRNQWFNDLVDEVTIIFFRSRETIFNGFFDDEKQTIFF
ncbi:hypothetical protein GCM10020331_002990 [Ectobacillus funiculus]